MVCFHLQAFSVAMVTILGGSIDHHAKVVIDCAGRRDNVS